MEANRMELDPSDQELEGSPIAGEISSVNHRSPCSSAPPTEGKVQLSDEQKKKKKIYDHRHREKKKRQEDDMMDQLESLEKTSGDLEHENVELKWERDHSEVKVEEENRRILSLLLDNNAGQNIEDIRTQAIIGRGTKRKGLYYVDDVASGHVHQVQSHNAYVHLQKTQRTKLEPCAIRCVFLGFNPHQKGYRCYHPSSRQMHVSMDVTFSETEYFFHMNPSSSSPQGELQYDAYNWIDLQSDSGEGNTNSGEGNTEQQQSASGEEMETSTRTISNAGEGNTEPSSRTRATDSAGKEDIEYNAHNSSDAEEEYMHDEITPSSPQIHVQDRPDIHEININGESSMGLNDQREMNEVPITSSTVSRGNPSMNPQTLPQSTKKKRKIIEASERIEILKKKIVKFDENNAVLRAEAHLLGKTLAILRNITAQMTTRKSDMLETFIMDYMLQTSGQRNTPFSTQLQNSGQGSTSFNTQLQLPFEMTEFGTGETGQPVYHPPVYQSGTIMGSGGPAIEESSGLPQSHLLQGWAHLQLPSGMTPDNTFSTGEAGLPVHHPPNYQINGTTMESGGPTIENPLGLPQSHVPQGWAHENQGQELDDVTFSLSDLLCFDNEETQELEATSS